VPGAAAVAAPEQPLPRKQEDIIRMTTPTPSVAFGPTILFCTDFSANADFAFNFAIEAARQQANPVLHLLHVIPEPEAQFWKTYLYEIEDIDAKARADIDARIQSAYLAKVPQGIPVEVSVRIGKDYMEILQFAEQIKADLVVIGRQGQSSWETMFFGNVTEKVARKSPCPVLIVPMCAAAKAAKAKK